MEEEEGEDEAKECKAEDGDDALPPAPSSPSAAPSSPSSSHSQSVLLGEAAARLRLEAEDDALLESMNLLNFPRSTFNPSAAELADDANALHDRRVDAELVPGLPARMYPLLAEKFRFLTTRLVSHQTSADGSTTKLLVRLADGQHVESVIMRHRIKDPLTGRVEQRITLCVSSQVGCAMKCSFCATGTMGFRANLLAGEILEQLVHANRFERIRNIVFMGMGEPLKNYEQVLTAIKAMTDANRFALAPSRITLSTVGIIPRMLDLTRDIPNIQLALSLHAPTQELREQIVLTARSYPLDKMIDAMQYFIQRSKKKVLIEYVLLEHANGDPVNAAEEHAHQLGKLLQGMEVLINLIPYNTTDVAVAYRAPARETSVAFQQILQKQYNLFTTIRVEMGADIDGACGQLALVAEKGAEPAGAAAVLPSAVSALKPRGLLDDTAMPQMDSDDAACASKATGMAGDIEDLGAAASPRAKRPVLSVASKRKAARSPTADNKAAPTPCCGEDAASPCDCEKPSAPASVPPAVAASPSSSTADQPAPEVAVPSSASAQLPSPTPASSTSQLPFFLALLALLLAVAYMALR